MISKAEYLTITNKISEMQDILANTEIVAGDMQSTINNLSIAYIGSNPLLNYSNTANELDYFEDINIELAGIESSSAAMTTGEDLNKLSLALENHILARYESIDEFLNEAD